MASLAKQVHVQIADGCLLYTSILAWKDHGDEECDRPFSDALCRLAERAGVIDAMDGVREICDTILVVQMCIRDS